MNPYDHVLLPIHRDGYKFVGGGAVAALIGFVLWDPLGWLGVAITLAIAFFFRDPPRVTPTRVGLVVSPADGIVAEVADRVPPEEIGMGEDPLTRISIFLSPLDVHINRIPISGTIMQSVHKPGAFVGPPLPGKGDDNERHSIKIKTAAGRELGVVQIAGVLARRIVCQVKEGQDVQGGDRYGLIRFGSRVDIYLDPKLKPFVTQGQRMIGGETVVADEKSLEAARSGELR